MALSDDGEDARPDDADGLTSLQWWLEVYPSLPPERRPIEFVQEPGGHWGGLGTGAGRAGAGRGGAGRG